MILTELKEKVDWLTETGHQDDEVIITTKDPSVGPRGGSGVLNILHGFDWERGQIRIEPEKPLLSSEKDRDKALPAIVRVYDDLPRKRVVRKCPKCENHVRKGDAYCSKCGQRISITE